MAADHLVDRANNKMSALVLGSGSIVLNGDEGGEDGLKKCTTESDIRNVGI